MKIDNIVYILIAVLIVVGAIMFFNSGYSRNNYTYENQGQKFEVRKLSDTDVQVKAYLGAEETPYILTFKYEPYALEDIAVEPTIKLRVSDDELIYISISPNLSADAAIQSSFELGKYLALPKFYGKKVEAALTMPIENDTASPVINCANATIYTTVFVLKTGDKNEAYLDAENNNCIIIEARNGDELIKVADRVAYHLVGIMP